MQRVEVQTERGSYPVVVGHGLLDRPDAWSNLLGNGSILVVSNDRVAPLYLDQLVASIDRNGTRTLVLPDGESEKHRDNWWRIQDVLAEMGALRDSCIVALGGGVICDLAGFAASTWMRGIDVVQVPTTLLAQVDASVGGKTGFNHPRGKNLVGAFHQPRGVIADLDTLATLDPREYRSGLAEVVKAALIGDAAWLDALRTDAGSLLARDRAATETMVAKAVAFKAGVVQADERERGARMLLNLGHTFAHALEAETNYERFLHGEAVAIGLVMAADLSERLGRCPNGLREQVTDLLTALELPTRAPAGLSADRLLQAMELDKKAVTGGWRLILLDGPGRAVVAAVEDRAAVHATLTACSD